MKVFGTGGYFLGDSRLEVRLVYSGFLLFVTIGFLTVAAFQLRQIGPTPALIATYYRGGERGDTIAFPKTARELLEVTHFHAFTMGVVYLVLAHLLLATRAPDRVKRAAVVVGLVAFTGDLAGGWLVRYGSASFAPVLLGCWVGQWLAVAVFVYYPVRDMWFGHG